MLVSEQELTPSSGPAAPNSPPSGATRDPWALRLAGKIPTLLVEVLPTLWRWLCLPWWKWVLSASAFLLIAAALLLPQLPADLVDNTTMATRWLIRTGADFKWGGEILQALGLFDVVHSLLLRGVLIIAGVILAVQLADAIGFAWTLTHIDRWLKRPPPPDGPEAGAPLPIRVPLPLYRLRMLQTSPVAASFAHLNTYVSEHYANFTRVTIPWPAGPAEDAGDHTADAAPRTEERLLARHNTQMALLRPSVPLGFLLLVLFVGLSTVNGWSISVLGLGPGEESSYSAQQLDVRYVLPPLPSDAATPGDEGVSSGAESSLQPPVQLQVRVGEGSKTIDANQFWFARVGGVYLRARYGDPSLLVRTVDGAPLLLLPSRGARSAHAGLVFPASGSEAFVVLPQQAIALRILRVAEENQSLFFVEVFDDFESATGENVQPTDVQPTDVQPSDRITVRDWQRIELDDGAVALEFRAMPGLDVRAVSLPSLWLLLLALLCLLPGSVSLRRRPAFLLAQVVPWAEQSVVIAQCSARDERDRLRAWLVAQGVDADDGSSTEGVS